MIWRLIGEAVESGARLDRACETLGLTARTVQRWRHQGEQGFDRRLEQFVGSARRRRTASEGLDQLEFPGA